MQLRARLVSLMLVVYSLRVVAVLPGEERLSVHSNRELSKERKEGFLKLLSGLLDRVDSSVVLGEDVSPMDLEEPLDSRLEERAIYNRLSQLPLRARKAPCKNFFWKTFTSC
uniref:Somatostatin pro2 n=1 Tax=Acipenser transmontanus TaxID=7904 RepID=Q90XE0_ACITR|nr:somatostatin precursor pro2 [Acipenser transmontanus]